jgi:hypothetical protein
MFECPYCDYENPEPGPVVAHATSKVDEAHKGVGGSKVAVALGGSPSMSMDLGLES